MMNNPLNCSSVWLNEWPWAVVMWDNYDELCARWGTRDIPNFLEPDDIWQDVFILLWQKELDGEDGIPSELEIITVIGYGFMIDAIRKERGRGDQPRVFFLVDDAGDDPLFCNEFGDPILHLTLTEDMSIVTEVCSPEQMELLWRVFIDGVSFQTIANEEGISRAGFRQKFNRLLEKIQHAFKRADMVPP